MDPDAVNVMVVDDEPDLLEVIRQDLELKGYVVRTALDGMEAMALLREARPHCVILDVSMPRIDGYEFAKYLRDTYLDDIVLIAMSGHPEDDPKVSSTFRIVDHYLPKPFDFAALDKILPDLTA